MKTTLALLLALFALTALAARPTMAATPQAPEPAAGIERAEPAPPSSYRGRFGSSAASRNARHLSSELEDTPADEARGCPDPDRQNPKPTPSAPCANQFL